MSEEQKRRLQAQLWSICNYLRGKMSGDEFRDYILGFIFFKFLSERLYAIAQNALEADGIQYEDLDENNPDHKEIIDAVRTEAVDALGYHLNPSQLFDQIAKKIKADKDAFVIGDIQQRAAQPQHLTQQPR